MLFQNSTVVALRHTLKRVKTMPQFPFIPLKGYINRSPTRQAGITTHVPLCPDGEGQGHRDAPPHRTASRTRVIGFTDNRLQKFNRLN